MHKPHVWAWVICWHVFLFPRLLLSSVGVWWPSPVNFCYTAVNQPHGIHTSSLPWIYLPFRSPRTLGRAPMLYSLCSLIVCFTHTISSVYTSIPISQSLPPTLSLWVHICLFAPSVSVSTLQISSSIPSKIIFKPLPLQGFPNWVHWNSRQSWESSLHSLTTSAHAFVTSSDVFWGPAWLEVFSSSCVFLFDTLHAMGSWGW